MLTLWASVDLRVMARVLCIPQSFSITGASLSDCWVSYLGRLFGDSYLSAEKQSMYFTANWTIKCKLSNLRKGVELFPTPRCSSYWKGCFRVVLDHSRPTYFTYCLGTIFSYIFWSCNLILIRCALFHSMCKKKAARMNLQCSLTRELKFYVFTLGNYIACLITVK